MNNFDEMMKFMGDTNKLSKKLGYKNDEDIKDELFESIEKNNLGNVYMLLESNSVDVNIKDDYGNTPLILAVLKGNKALVKYLIDNNADVSINNNDNETALSLAKKYRTILKTSDIIRILKKEEQY